MIFIEVHLRTTNFDVSSVLRSSFSHLSCEFFKYINHSAEIFNKFDPHFYDIITTVTHYIKITKLG